MAMFARHVTATAVRMKNMEEALVTCPEGFILILERNTVKNIEVEWSHRFNQDDIFAQEWPHSNVPEWDIKFLDMSGGACLYTFNIENQPVAIGELYMYRPNDDTIDFDKRVKELKRHRTKIYGFLNRSNVYFPGNERVYTRVYTRLEGA
ncbi:hypothetical protein FRC03_004365 [Tulasnella sp. 419]|nr:hypothetical protein FRC03_004365 [Tulasnella sp. 419]